MLGGRKYQMKGCAGQGGFAQVFKAFIDSNPDEVVALKVDRPLKFFQIQYDAKCSYCIYKSLHRYKNHLFLGNSTCIANLIAGSQIAKYALFH